MRPQDSFLLVDEPGLRPVVRPGAPRPLVGVGDRSQRHGRPGGRFGHDDRHLRAISSVDDAARHGHRSARPGRGQPDAGSASTATRIADPADWPVLSSEGNLTILERTRPTQLAIPGPVSDVSLALTRWSDDALDWQASRRARELQCWRCPTCPTGRYEWTARGCPASPRLATSRCPYHLGPVGSPPASHGSLADKVGPVVSFLSLLAIAFVLWPQGRGRHGSSRPRASPQPVIERDPVVTWIQLVSQLSAVEQDDTG